MKRPKSSLPKTKVKKYTNAENKFYVSGYCQNPKSKMARTYLSNISVSMTAKEKKDKMKIVNATCERLLKRKLTRQEKTNLKVLFA